MKSVPRTRTVCLARLASFAFFASVFCTSVAFARDGANTGGGGDVATERRIDDIRVDILRWISDGGGNGLNFLSGLDSETYSARMIPLLAPHAVVIGAVTASEEAAATDSELKVVVEGSPKTCRGFVSQRDQLPHILCNVERFAATSESDQYQLIHHEFAGLAGIEQNLGSSSDYSVSRQLTGFLEEQTVLKLTVKKRESQSVQCRGKVCDPLELSGLYRLVAGDKYCSPSLEIRVRGGTLDEDVIHVFTTHNTDGAGLPSYGVRPILFDTQTEQVQQDGFSITDRIHHEQWMERQSDRIVLVRKTTQSAISPWYLKIFDPSSTSYNRIDLRPTSKGRLQYVRYNWDANLNNRRKAAGYSTAENCLYGVK